VLGHTVPDAPVRPKSDGGKRVDDRDPLRRNRQGVTRRVLGPAVGSRNPPMAAVDTAESGRGIPIRPSAPAPNERHVDRAYA
jgi:hypothetical protein